MAILTKQPQQYGIQTILTKPEQLTINTINEYLEIKARDYFDIYNLGHL